VVLALAELAAQIELVEHVHNFHIVEVVDKEKENAHMKVVEQVEVGPVLEQFVLVPVVVLVELVLQVALAVLALAPLSLLVLQKVVCLHSFLDLLEIPIAILLYRY
jgi:hypothetical protein